MSLLISCIISSQVDANPKKGAERDFSFERPHERRRHGSSSLFVFYFPWRLAVVLRARFQSPATPNTTQRSNARRVRSFRIILQKKKKTNVESFTLIAKLTAVSENLSFLCWVWVGNEVTVMHKFCRPEIRFAGTCSASFLYELRARKLLSCFKLQGCERPDVT